jgi:hypothetical protein
MKNMGLEQSELFPNLQLSEPTVRQYCDKTGRILVSRCKHDCERNAIYDLRRRIEIYCGVAPTTKTRRVESPVSMDFEYTDEPRPERHCNKRRPTPLFGSDAGNDRSRLIYDKDAAATLGLSLADGTRVVEVTRVLFPPSTK